MLLVETHHPREQALLQEDFNRDSNYFAVPFKKAEQIEQLIQTMRFETFHSKENCKDLRTLHSSYPELVENITSFVQKMLKNTLCLKSLRQIFHLIHMQEQKIGLFETHILHLNRLLMDEESCDQDNRDIEDLEMEGLFQGALQGRIRSVTTLESELSHQENGADILTKLASKNKLPQPDLQSDSENINSDSSIAVQNQTSEAPKPKKQLRSSISLRLEIPSSPQYKQSLQEILNQISHRKKKNHFLEESFDEGDENQSGVEPEEVKSSKFCIPEDVATNETYYCPAWKRASDQQIKNLDIALLGNQTVSKKKPMDTSEFISNLSGRFKPNPSILNEDNISDMIKKEKKQDVRKSNIFKNSIRGGVDAPFTNQKLYNEKIKMMKIQHRLNPNRRKTSKGCSPQMFPHQQPQENQFLFKKKDVSKKNMESEGKREGNGEISAGGMLNGLTGFFKFKKVASNK